MSCFLRRISQEQKNVLIHGRSSYFCKVAARLEDPSGPFTASPFRRPIVVLSALCFCVKNKADSVSARGSRKMVSRPALNNMLPLMDRMEHL